MPDPHGLPTRRALGRGLAVLLCAAVLAGGPLAVPALAAPHSPKVSPVLARLIDAMEADGVTAEAARGRDLSGYSTPAVRVDAAGRVQVYVEVENAGEEALAALEMRGLRVESSLARHGLVQGWIAFDRVDALADDPNVRRVRPPSYARPRTPRP
jgi:hypothetical protein